MSLGFCLENGYKALQGLENNRESSKITKMFARAAIWGANLQIKSTGKLFKQSLEDQEIDQYHRSNALLIFSWCRTHADEVYFKIHRQYQPYSQDYKNFINWGLNNKKLPDAVKAHFLMDVEMMKMNQRNRELWTPKNYSQKRSLWSTLTLLIKRNG